ncbi:MAG: DnaD domain protein [Bacilli bacterium]|nr:DnaD domain protein [Bacilli bacterium]
METLYMILNDNKFVINATSLKMLKTLDLSVNEILFIIFFDNSCNKEFNPSLLNDKLGLSEVEVMETLDSLVKKKLISLDLAKDSYNKSVEVINLDNFYNIVLDTYNNITKSNDKENIYDTYASEFDRKLTGMEYEIINGWLDNGYPEELILGALKEAIFNGVKNFRYIDKILLEWSKKGYKTMADVNKGLKNNKEDKKGEIFDYNWLEEDE